MLESVVGLVCFHFVLWHIEGYLISSPFNIYVCMISKKHFVDNTFKRAEAHFFAQLNGFTYTNNFIYY